MRFHSRSAVRLELNDDERRSISFAVMPVVVVATGMLMLTAVGNATARQVVDTPPEVVTINDLDASGDNPVYFSFERRAVVGADEVWDVSFTGTTIGVNGEALVVDRAFTRIDEAPESGYRAETEDQPAIPTDADLRWFDYDSNTHVVSPVPFRTIIVHTAEGRYAKLEIVDYYDGLGTPRFYTFRYAYQTSGSRSLGPASDG